MSTTLLQYVADCFQGNFQGMHCLGAVSGGETASPPSTGVGNRGGVMSVVRALGVLVCEGRLQGPPRGYKEGPHCAAPLQSSPNDHVCEKDNYLCTRYLVLVREIADRVSIGSSLSVEVLMCTDCPCGHARATCNKPAVSVMPASSISQWQHPSDKLLEYWYISVVPSKCTETMNAQGLYQAVRSRLHFSQVAAWWSRSNGTRPSYVTTRIVSHSDDNLRKFCESPIQHTFPLAAIGDGNSIEVTVWALPRMEEVPVLNCPLHPSKEIDEECTARASTPTKNGPLPSSNNHNVDNLLLPVLVDDRLQTGCDKPGKHHCHCEDDDTNPPSPSIRPNGERKRRRSLPCGPSHETASTSAHVPLLLSSVRETVALTNNEIPSHMRNYSRYIGDETNCLLRRNRNEIYENRSYLSTGSLERCFRKQVSLEEDGNEEKRYKPSMDNHSMNNETNLDEPDNRDNENTKALLSSSSSTNINNEKINHIQASKNNDSNATAFSTMETTVFSDNPVSSTSGSWIRDNLTLKNSPPCTVHRIYPRLVTAPINEAPSSNGRLINEETMKNSPSELTELMAELSFPKDKKESTIVSRDRRDAKFIDWFEKTPRHVQLPSSEEEKNVAASETRKNEVRLKNCNLELSQREFNEVLAVLRTRTPTTSRRRAPSIKILRRRDREEKYIEDTSTDKNKTKKLYRVIEPTVCPIHREKARGNSSNDNCECKMMDEIREIPESRQDPSNKADLLLGAILRTGRDRKGLSDISNGTKPRNLENNPPENKAANFSEEKSLPNVLNKRLSRFRQLFQKELEKRKITSNETITSSVTPDAAAKDRTEAENNSFTPRRDRVKRKNDFANFSYDTEKSERDYQRIVDDSISETHENKCNSTNNQRLLQPSSSFASSNTTHLKSNDEKYSINNNATYAPFKKNATTDDFYCDDETTEKGVPSAIEQEQFRRSFENAASMVFHSRTGLPLTSSPAPLRRGHCCFDYDSTLNSVSSKRSALFELNTPPSPGAVSLEEADREIEISADGEKTPKRQSTTRIRPQSHSLLGSFEESALNGRLEPVSTVHGFTAELGASGSFCPKHRKLPVTVFFYTLGDNDKVSTPYLAHINLGKKGYQVPRSGTIQVTLLNPLGTVVKMFVVLYDLSDMPPRSHTFLRQRILRDKTLRYLVHLRFISGKSGRIYLHTDIRMIICRKSDVDTASDFGSEPPKELRSYTHGPTNPKFSPRC